MLKENFLESAPKCIGVHLQGDELVRPEMNLNAKGELFRRVPRTGFFGSTACLTEEKMRRVGKAITDSLCACILLENTHLKCVERVYIYI